MPDDGDMPAQYIRWASTALKSGQRLADLKDLADKLTPEQRARVTAWVTNYRQSHSLEGRIAQTVRLADELMPDADTVEQKEACAAYATRARALAQALSIAAEQQGRHRRKARTRIKHSATELQAEMIAFLMERGTVAES